MNTKLLLTVAAVLVVGLGGFALVTKRVASRQNVASGQTTMLPNTGEIANVEVTSAGFQPQTLNISAGTTVTWVNKSGGVISVNSDPHPIHDLYPPLNLGRVDDGGSVSLRFDTPGSYGYHNHLMPSQTGTIIVQ